MTIKIKIWIILVVIAGLIILWNLVSYPVRPERLTEGEYTQLMETSLYTPVSEASKPTLPDTLQEVLEDIVGTSISGSGVWTPSEAISVGDSIPVELSAVELEDGTFWVKASINGDVVQWKNISRFEKDPPTRRWELQGEISNCEEHPFGIGIGYQLIEIFDFGISPSISINTDLKWIAGEVKISRRIFSSVAGNIGYGQRFFFDSGEHLTAGISIKF